MKILLVRFKIGPGKSYIPWHYSYYKDILSKEGHVVDIIDNQIENYTPEHLVGLVIEGKYQLVGTGGLGSVYKDLKVFCRLIKSAAPEVTIVIGGQIIADHEFILNTISADIIVCGEGEITLSKIIAALENHITFKTIPGIAYKERDSIIVNPPEKPVNLNELPNYNLENININKYSTEVCDVWVDNRAKELKEQGHKRIIIYLSRGCPFKCFFCYRQLKQYRTVNDEKIESIFSHLKSNGFSFLSFHDEILTAKKTTLDTICKLALKYEVYWTVFARVDQVTPDLLKKLKQSHCMGLQFGVESFDQQMLDVMDKKTTPEQNINALNWCFQYGLQTNNMLLLVLGSPGENRSTIFNTRKGMWECYLKSDQVSCGILTPYPGTPAYFYGLDKGYITDKEMLHNEVDSKKDIVINFSQLSDRELRAWHQWIILEGALSFRLKQRTLLIYRSFLGRIYRFCKAYMFLLVEPFHFLMFNMYLVRGVSYWLKPIKKYKWGELVT